MSLSSNNSQDPAGLEHLSVSPIRRRVPALEKDDAEQQTTLLDEKEKEGSTDNSAEQSDTPEPETAASPAEDTPVADAPETTAQKRRDIKWQGLLLDTVLVCMVVAVLAVGGYYLKTQWDIYRVPTVMEVANKQCEELCKRREELQDAYNHADEQLLMRSRVADFDKRLARFAERTAQLNASIAEQKKLVLALQHEIRRADKEARSVAKGLLPGLQIGDVTTTRGKVYNNATISRIEGSRISLRTPYGAASFPVRELVKDNLPDMVLYALNIIDLVDMSDFTATGEAPTTPQPKNEKLRTEVKPLNASDYEPKSGGAVLDTSAGNGVSPIFPTAPRNSGDSWQAPDGDLPL